MSDAITAVGENLPSKRGREKLVNTIKATGEKPSENGCEKLVNTRMQSMKTVVNNVMNNVVKNVVNNVVNIFQW